VKNQFVTAVRVFITLTVLTGAIYPLAVTAIGQMVFKKQAMGSIISKNGEVIGSALIQQSFKDPKHFWGRPSAVDMNSLSSGGSNLGPTSADLKAKIDERRAAGLAREMLASSGSGLDPHISVESALDQVNRIAAARNLDETGRAKLVRLIELMTEKRDLGIFGEPRVNVLKLNLVLSGGV
jgi:K+-transporting ATPase ATPase C chain